MLRVSIPMLMFFALLAALSLVEFALPKTKSFTFPAMIVTLALIMGLHLFHRVQAWRATRRWLHWTVTRDRSASAELESRQPIEPE